MSGIAWAGDPPYRENSAIYVSGPTKVLVIGGSIAHGWDDRSGGGFLKRAFFTTFHDTFIDQTITGGTSTMLQATAYKGDFEKWLTNYHPNIVVISWGLLNDCKARTPVATFKAYLHQEIAEALQAHAVVYVVTPPVVIASYERFQSSQQAYVNEEQSVVEDMHNSNVYFFNVFDQMKQYLALHHMSVYEFGTNTWHPDTEGHIIAAQLLLQDLKHAHLHNLVYLRL